MNIHPEIKKEYVEALAALGDPQKAREAVRVEALKGMVDLDTQIVVALCGQWSHEITRRFIGMALKKLWREHTKLDRMGAPQKVTDQLLEKYNALRDVYCDLKAVGA